MTNAAALVDYEPLREKLEPELRTIATNVARLGLDQVDVSLAAALKQANQRAIAWADARAAQLIKGIDETTREAVKSIVAHALEEGLTTDELADALEDSEAFTPARAETIARTETAAADVQGNIIGWQESGVVEAKEWIVADANECEACAAMHGQVVGLDDEFPEGDPPLHPNCRCDVLPVLKEPE